MTEAPRAPELPKEFGWDSPLGQALLVAGAELSVDRRDIAMWLRYGRATSLPPPHRPAAFLHRPELVLEAFRGHFGIVW
jgi:hypothetical protein